MNEERMSNTEKTTVSPIHFVDQDLYEIRNKIHPRSVSGVFAYARILMVVLTQLLFYGLPWLSWNGRQAVLFDLVTRKFYIFNLVLWPQDIIYLTLLLILSALALFLFTAIAGRLFCGYACPQTVYTEIFLWVERRVEGDRLARMKLDDEKWPWSFKKLRLKICKHFIWLSIAVWTGFTFVGYFTPIVELWRHFIQFDLGVWPTFWLCFYSFATWGNAGFLREQVCKYMCPYARFQSVMVDKDTFVVTYDSQRGEPRGGRSKSVDHKASGLGDCVDCSICVQVCPTGIDIRNGMQYMCIGCGACVDACNQVMDKVEYPKGLIRYTTQRAIEEKLDSSAVRKYLFRPRILIYSGIMAILITAFVTSLVIRNPLRFDVMRDRGALAREVNGDQVENIYRIQVMNSSESPMKLELAINGLEHPEIYDSQNQRIEQIEVPASANMMLPVKVRISEDSLHKGPNPVVFVMQGHEISAKGVMIPRKKEEKSTFIMLD